MTHYLCVIGLQSVVTRYGCNLVHLGPKYGMVHIGTNLKDPGCVCEVQTNKNENHKN